MTGVVSLQVNNFRGASTGLTIDFTNDKGVASSTLILGDNGSGKSSVADAIEFCLRGKLSRRGTTGAKNRREARNLLHEGPPSVSMSLADGKKLGRGALGKEFAGTRLARSKYAPGFGLCPVTLSRADIESFWNFDKSERLRFFFDYLREGVDHEGHAALEGERIEAELAKNRTRILEAQIQLATVAGVDAADIPIDGRVDFYRWRSTRYPAYGAVARPYGSKDKARAAAIGKVPARVRQALANLARFLEEEHKQRKVLSSKKTAERAEGEVPGLLAADLPLLVKDVSTLVSADFIKMAALPHVKEVKVEVAEAGHGLDVRCVLANGQVADPIQVLSEGALDLLALLLMLSLAQACAGKGQSKVLVLDDVWQSVDAVHRSSILNFLFKRFVGWQLVITVHDKLWARLIEDRARKAAFPLKVVELSSWSPEYGPQVRYGGLSTLKNLLTMIEHGVPEAMVAFAGRALEELSDTLSVALAVAVTRKAGDRYTLEDLWPPVRAKLVKSAPSMDIKTAATKVDEIYDLRNTYAAHYNEWAEGMSSTEAKEFSDLVVNLWQLTHCDVCGAVLSRIGKGSGSYLGWSCGHQQQAESSKES